MVPAWFHLVPTWFHRSNHFVLQRFLLASAWPHLDSKPSNSFELVFFRGGAEEATLDEEFGARLWDICDHINTHFDVEGLCEGLPSRVQIMGGNPEGSALFLLGMQNSIAHALPRHAPEGCCGDMWGVKLKAGPEPA